MTMEEALKLNFPLSGHLPAYWLRKQYAGTYTELQHDPVLVWYRLGDGEVRWQNHNYPKYDSQRKTIAPYAKQNPPEIQ